MSDEAVPGEAMPEEIAPGKSGPDESSLGQSVPDEIRAILDERGRTVAYRARPPCPRNDCLGWISRAQRETVRAPRLARMLGGRVRGDVCRNAARSAGRNAH